MAIALTSNRNNTSYGINSYVADDETDIKDLPVDVQPGSTCIVVNPTSVYMLNTKQEWVKL